MDWLGGDMANADEISARFLIDRPRLVAYAVAVVRVHALAEDLVQDAFVALSQALARGDAIADSGAWCRGVVRNLALRHWHADRRLQRLPTPDLLDGIDRAFAEDDSAQDDELLRALVACREGVSVSALTLLDLRYVDGLPMRAVAERCRRSERAVITALARVRRHLVDCITTRLRRQGHD